MRKSLLVRQVVPHLFWYAILIATALGVDELLHRVGLFWFGRYLGIPGVGLILVSFLYSLRKRGLLQTGSPKRLLDFHEALSWAGALLILIHAGIHFHALLPWAAVVMMLAVVASGFTGRYLLKEAREAQRSVAPEGAPEARIFLDALTVDAMRRWRSIHLPITAIFAILVLLHIVSILIFWRW